MGKHNKEKRKQYLKNRRAKLREVKLAGKRNGPLQADSPTPNYTGDNSSNSTVTSTRTHTLSLFSSTDDTCTETPVKSSSASGQTVFKRKPREVKLTGKGNGPLQADSPTPNYTGDNGSNSTVTSTLTHTPSFFSSTDDTCTETPVKSSLVSGQTVFKRKPSDCSTNSTAAILRGEIPKSVQNDILVRKWKEYDLLQKQLTLIKRRMNVIEYGKQGELLNRLNVDMKR